MWTYFLLLTQSNRLCKFAVLSHVPDTIPTSTPTFTSLQSPRSFFSVSDAGIDSTHPLRKLINKDAWCRSHDPTHRANSSSPGMFKSKHRMMWFAFNSELSAITPAMSMLFIVRSRCSKEVDSGRNTGNGTSGCHRC